MGTGRAAVAVDACRGVFPMTESIENAVIRDGRVEPLSTFGPCGRRRSVQLSIQYVLVVAGTPGNRGCIPHGCPIDGVRAVWAVGGDIAGVGSESSEAAGSKLHG